MHPVRDALAGCSVFEGVGDGYAGDNLVDCGALQEGVQGSTGDGPGSMLEPVVRKLVLSDFLQAVSDMQPARSMYSCEE